MRTKSMKRPAPAGRSKFLAAFLAAAAMLSAFAGCGSSGGPSSAADSSSAASGASSGSGAAENSAGTGRLVFWNVAYKTVDDTGVVPTDELILNKTIDAFEKEHNVKVELVNQTYDNIFQLFKTAGLAKNGPDVAFLWAGGYTNDYREFIEPLDGYFTAEELGKFPNLDLCRVDFKSSGELLAIPTDMTTLNLYYNKEAFAKAGLAADARFQTFDELTEACGKIAAAGVQPLAMTDGNGYTSAWVVGETLTHKLGPADIYGLRDGQIKMTDESAVQSMQQWADFCKTLIENQWVNEDAFTTATDEVFMGLFTGDVAMRFGGSWDAQVLFEEMGENVGTMPIPAFSADEPYADHITAQFSNNLAVTNYSKNKELAVEFIKALTTPEFYLGRFDQDQQLPARLDVNLDDATVHNPLSIDSYAWIQADRNVVGFDAVISADSSAEFYRLSPMVISGKMSAEEAMKAVQEKNV